MAIFQWFKNTKRLPISDRYVDFLESPSDKLQIFSRLVPRIGTFEWLWPMDCNNTGHTIFQETLIYRETHVTNRACQPYFANFYLPQFNQNCSGSGSVAICRHHFQSTRITFPAKFRLKFQFHTSLQWVKLNLLDKSVYVTSSFFF